MFVYSIFVTTIIFNVAAVGKSGCPKEDHIKPCSCRASSKGLGISCEGAKLDQIREALGNVSKTKKTVLYLNLRYDKLNKLPSKLMVGLEVRHLIAMNCNLSSVDEHAFEEIAGKLETMELVENAFEIVPSKALRNLSALVSLNMNFNKIEILYDEAFKGLNSLRRLSLYGNRINSISSQTFVGIGRTLTWLNLGRNGLTKIPSRSLRVLSALRRLQLDENKIANISFEEISAMGGQSLEVLDLSSNKVEKIPHKAFLSMTKLDTLDLEGNNIKSIELLAFQGQEDSLEWLKLAGNRLEEIPYTSLKNLSNLKDLDLKDNNISKVREDDFSSYGKNLKFINLEKNRIKYIDPAAFENLDSLESLHLESNQLTTARYETYAPVLNNLKHFYLRDNPFHCDCRIFWLRDWMKGKGSRVIRRSEETTCVAPVKYENRPLADIPTDQRACGLTASTRSLHSIVLLSAPLLAITAFLPVLLL